MRISIWFAHLIASQIRYPVNQRLSRGGGNRYRVPGPPAGMPVGGFNQKAPQRMVNKQKKPKPKKEDKKSSGEEDEAEKKIILKDEENDEKQDDKTENG